MIKHVMLGMFSTVGSVWSKVNAPPSMCGGVNGDPGGKSSSATLGGWEDCRPGGFSPALAGCAREFTPVFKMPSKSGSGMNISSEVRI